MHVTRWGQSEYETDADMRQEALWVQGLQCTWALHPDVRTPPNLSITKLLVVTSKVRVDADVLAGTPVTHVLTTTSGYDHFDVAGLAEAGITMGRCPGARRDAVVEHALGAMLGLGKNWPTQLQRARDGVWARAELPAFRPLGLAGAPILIIGLGVIGQQMALVLQALGAVVLGVDPRGVPEGVEAVELEEGLRRCAAVTVHCSLTSSSANLLTADRIALLRPDAVLVNTARGEVLDIDAATLAVEQGRLRGLAVDVFPEEPCADRFARAQHPNLWFTAHAAGYVPTLGAKVTEEVFQSCRRVLHDGGFHAPVTPGDL